MPIAATTGIAETVHLGVEDRIALLHAAVVPGCDDVAQWIDERAADRYAAFARALEGLLVCGIKGNRVDGELIERMLESHCV